MALPGMKSTADFAADERPKNWRDGILLLSPRNDAPLFALTAAMKSEVTDDPEFYWWEEPIDMHQVVVSGAQTNVDTAIELVALGTRLKAGDVLKNGRTGEAVRVVSVTSDTVINVTRAIGPGGTLAGTAAAMNDTDVLMFVGSGYREGAPRSSGVSWAPTKRSNVTQIFRDPIEITRTAEKTRYRTGNPLANDRRRALHKHSIGLERAFWLGTRYETTESGQPLRFTDGVLNRIPAANIKTVVATGQTAGYMDLDEFESYLAGIFAYGSREKLAFVSLNVMLRLATMVRKNTEYQWGPREKEFNLSVRRFHTPAGTLIFTEHPLFGQAGQFLADDMVVMDTANLKFRYVTDTVLLKDRETPGDDGKVEEYLTEAGLEVHHPDTFFWLKGIKGGAKDN